MDLIEVMVFLPVKGTYYYSVPERLSSFVEVGKRVKVPFRNRKVTGFIVKKDVEIDTTDYEIKDIIDILDDKPVLTPKMLDLTKWVSEYYLCPFWEVLKSAFPDSNPRREKLIQSENDTFLKEVYPSSYSLYQKNAFEEIENFIKKGRFSVFLLHGGKIELCLHVIRNVLMEGKGVIILIPELSEYGLTIDRFKELFPNRIAILHSKTLKSERGKGLKRIQKGEAIIVIGTRQAIFSPMSNLGLIVVLEEGERTYKQKVFPVFNARDVAIMRGKIEDVPVLLVSTTPSVESYYNARKGKYYYLNLQPIESETPKIKIIDMRKERKDNKKGILSDYLKKEIRRRLEKKEQVILFLNRRGFSRFIQCRECGYVLTCPNCEIALTYYSDKSCRCHYCNHKIHAPSICPNCRGYEITHFGFGTQHVEEEIKRIFPECNVIRLDTDSCRSKKVFESTIEEFRIKRKSDILIGTQMIIKDLEFQGVSLIGIISGDALFALPDFRAGERGYSLLTKAIKMVRKGEVVIQTYNPMHYVIRGVKTGDFHAFYKKEIVSRKRLMYPPFSHIINIIIKGKDKEEVIKVAANLGDYLRKNNHFDIQILGPVPSIISKIKGKFRFQIILKAKRPSDGRRLLQKSLHELSISPITFIDIDVDPRDVM